MTSRRLAVCLGATLGLIVIVSSSGEAQAIFRSGVDIVNFGVTVTDDDGNFVSELARDDFEIVEEGAPQTITYFSTGDATIESVPPTHIGLLFDTSGSMEDDLRFSRRAAIKFLNTLTEAVDITLVDFDTEVRVARYGQADFPRLVERIRMREPEGWTALYDALGVYLDGAGFQDGRKILVIYTDGGDTRSSMSFADTLDLLRASDVTVYAIGFLQHQRSSTRMDQRRKLSQIAEITGGQAFFPRTVEELDEMYAKAVAEIRAQYTLGYTPSDRRTDGAWRDVRVRVTRPDLKDVKIRTRKGYFGPYVEITAGQR